jgi:SnoaL-like polyketide cyclase
MTAARTERHESAVVRRLVNEMMNEQRLDILDPLCTTTMGPEMATLGGPIPGVVPGHEMEIVQLVTEGDTVAGRFTCSATHTGEWRGHAASGRRFENVDEVYFFEFEDGRIAKAWGIEDTLDRMRQLGLTD